MKNWIIENKIYAIGAVVGGAAGFAYWKYVGCLTGTCAITSQPVNSTVYFGFLGALLFGFFKQPPGKTGQSKKDESAGTPAEQEKTNL